MIYKTEQFKIKSTVVEDISFNFTYYPSPPILMSIGNYTLKTYFKRTTVVWDIFPKYSYQDPGVKRKKMCQTHSIVLMLFSPLTMRQRKTKIKNPNMEPER